MHNSTPILFLIFNRPEHTQKAFEAIRRQQPQQLFIAADGPRDDKPGERELCETTREIISRIDWECETKTLLRDENLGCKIAVSSAIDWFFENVDEGIILEDDCLPHDSFFPFCTELLERYRYDDKVMSISGSNLLGRPWKSELQSYFYAHGGIWGWATWKHAWSLYDAGMKDWHKSETKALIRNNLKTEEWYNFYYSMFESSYNGSLDTWDLQWFYTILINNGLAINPSVNLVENIGFGSGTHTQSDDNLTSKLALNIMNFPLKHPEKQETDVDYLKVMYNEVFAQPKNQMSFLKKILNVFR